MIRLSFAACLGVLLAMTACANQETPTAISSRQQCLRQGGTFQSGDWEYVLTIKNAGTRSEGSEGHLFFQQRELSAPSDLNNYYDTPLGRFRHTGTEPGQEHYLWDDTGWTRISESEDVGEGTALAWPAAE
jgi:hypothetical protein